MSETPSLAAQYAAKMSKGVVKGAILTGRIVRTGATAIMVAAMVSNYHHQVDYLGHHVDWLTARIVPIALDLLTVLCARVLATAVMHAISKKAALRSIFFPVLASGALSAMAPGDLISKIVFAGMVGLIPIAEYVASHIKVDFKLAEVAETEIAMSTPGRRKMDPEKAAARAAKSRATREANKLAALPVGQRRAMARKQNASVAQAYELVGSDETVAAR